MIARKTQRGRSERSIRPMVSDERGAALAIALMIMVILALLGSAAIMTSTTEVEIAGNERQYQMAFYAADGGAELTPRVIEDTIDLGAVPDFGEDITVIDSFYNEIMGYSSPTSAPEIQIASLNTSVNVSSRTGYLPGMGVRFAAGYLGIGAGAGGGGAAKFFTMDSQSQGARNASALIRSYYQHVIGMTGGS